MIPARFVPKALQELRERFTTEADVIFGKPGTAPIAIPGATPSVLCIHGFTGVPQEVQLGCDVASSLGLAAEAPCLAGHCGSSDQLSRVGFDDWVASVRPSFDRLRARGPVILVGLSLGAVIASQLALSAPGDVAGIALLANAFWLKSPYPALALEAADRLGVTDFGVRKVGSDIEDIEARRSHVSYQVQPVRAAISLLRAGQTMREELHRLHRPTLIVHGARDAVCPVDNSWKVAQRLGTRDVRVVILPRSKHIVTRDVEREVVEAELRAFMKRFCEPTSGGGQRRVG